MWLMADKEDLNLGKGKGGEGEKAGGKGKLLIIIVAVLVLAGGGAAAFLLLGGSDDAVEDGGEAEVVQEAPREPIYVPVAKLLVNLEHQGRTHYVQAEMQLMSYSQDAADQAQRDMPAIRDALITLFNSQDFAALKTPEGKEALRDAARAAVNDALGRTAPDAVEEIYFENFVLQ
jgi:flagellar FliL protein